MKSKSKAILDITNLTIERGDDFVLRIDQLRYPAGRIVCLAGANGSGKTTLVECLVGILVPGQGKIAVHNHLVKPESMVIKKEVGFVPDDDTWIVAELTAHEYFELLIRIYKKAGVRVDMERRVADLAKVLLFNDGDLLLGDLSHGNKKKVQIIAALLHEPRLIVVDEVRNGLDPIVIKRVEKLLQKEARRGATILAATHDLWWAERFAQSIIFLQQGQVVLSDNKANILKAYGSLEASFEKLFNSKRPLTTVSGAV
jgi:ABC-2 type transport system ATP-binding protein